MTSPVTTIFSSLLIVGPFLASNGGMVFCQQEDSLWLEALISAFIYHTTGSLASHHFRSIGIPCSLYIDDRHIGQLTIRPAPKSNSSPVPLPKPDILLAKSALFIVCYFLSALGNCIGLSKSILVPRQQVPYLGFISDSCLQAFTLIPAKKGKFIAFLRDILSRETVHLSRYKSWLVNVFLWPWLFPAPVCLLMRSTWPSLKLLALRGLLSFVLLCELK